MIVPRWSVARPPDPGLVGELSSALSIPRALAALLVLREAGGAAHAFVPHRVRDGYDFGPAGLARARELGADVEGGTLARRLSHIPRAAASGTRAS